MGSVNRGGGVSGYPREDESSRYWIQNSLGQGQSTTLYDGGGNDESDSWSAPAKMSAEMNREERRQRFRSDPHQLPFERGWRTRGAGIDHQYADDQSKHSRATRGRGSERRSRRTRFAAARSAVVESARRPPSPAATRKSMAASSTTKWTRRSSRSRSTTIQ